MMGVMLESCSGDITPQFVLGLRKGSSKRKQDASEKNINRNAE